MATHEKRGNSYRIVVSSGYNLDGNQIRTTMTWTPDPGMTPKQVAKELEKKKIEFERRVQSGLYISSKVRFSEYAEMWMNRCKEGAERALAPKTYERYVTLLTRINPAIGHLKLEDIQPHHIREFINNLKEEGIKDKATYTPIPKLIDRIKAQNLSMRSLAMKADVSANTVSLACKGRNISKIPAEKISWALGIKFKDLFKITGEKEKLADRTILQYYRLISAILTSAVVDDNVLVANPAKQVRAPRCERLEAESLDEVQATHLIDLIESEPIVYKTIIKVLVFTGTRRGEAMGLKWQDVDFDNRLISIRRSLQYTPEKGAFEKAPKTRRSIRTIKVPMLLVNAIREYKTWQNEQRLAAGDLWEDNNWVFTAFNGKPMNPDTFSGWFSEFIMRTDLPKIHIHNLRHTNATLLIAGGENISTVSHRLGHAQTSTTMNIYSHAIESRDAKAAEMLEDIFAPTAKKGSINTK